MRRGNGRSSTNQRRVPINILKEWERDPPRTEMSTMTALWYDFKRRRRDPKSPVCRFRDNIPEYCAEAESADEAIRRAVRSIRPNGKMHNHQSKVSKALPAFEDRLLTSSVSLTRMTTFGQLYSYIEMLATPGIGPMTTYDVAVRLGAWAKLKPSAIYFHAGTLAGLKALGMNTKGCL